MQKETGSKERKNISSERKIQEMDRKGKQGKKKKREKYDPRTQDQDIFDVIKNMCTLCVLNECTPEMKNKASALFSKVLN